MYLRKFTLLSDNQETDLFNIEKRNIFNQYYPLKLFPVRGLHEIEFSNITFFYGGNGSGKSTLLNIIAKTIEAKRKGEFNKGVFFELYTQRCTYDMNFERPREIKILTSDDVFEFLLDLRSINSGVHRAKEDLCSEFLQAKYDVNQKIETYQQLKDKVDARRHTMSRFARERLKNNTILEQSNGESALEFWQKEIQDNGIYILDEPENSLSIENQLRLKQFIEDSVRFFGCQFIISSHSSILLSLPGATIYDLDDNQVIQKRWNELTSVKLLQQFFKEHEYEFEE